MSHNKMLHNKILNNKILNNKNIEIKKIKNKLELLFIEDENKFENMTLTIKILIVCLAFTFYGKIFYYLYSIDESCKCIRDWRYKYALIMTCIILALSFIPFIGIKNKTFRILKYIYIVFSFINAYALYTYIDDLQKTKCSCAIDKQPEMNKYMIYYRYSLLFSTILTILLFIII